MFAGLKLDAIRCNLVFGRELNIRTSGAYKVLSLVRHDRAEDKLISSDRGCMLSLDLI